jgi:uncharacterized membrane protein
MIDAKSQNAIRFRTPAQPVEGGKGMAIGLGLLAILGIGIAGYMSYTDLLHAVPMCGGIGDCETVHTSAYAYFFGIPVGIFGLLSYIVASGLIVVRLMAGRATAYLASLGILVITISGTIFSLYLTFLEFFVIDAVCPWCVASAITISIMLVLSAADVRQAIHSGG